MQISTAGHILKMSSSTDRLKVLRRVQETVRLKKLQSSEFQTSSVEIFSKIKQTDEIDFS